MGASDGRAVPCERTNLPPGRVGRKSSYLSDLSGEKVLVPEKRFVGEHSSCSEIGSV